MSQPSETFELSLQATRNAHQFFITRPLRLLPPPSESFELPLQTARRYGSRAVMLEIVATVPEMVGGMLLHCKSLRRFEQSGWWIKAPLEEAENKRMHLMTFMEVAKPNWYERALIFAVQGVFFKAYFVTCILSPKLAHRIARRLLQRLLCHLHSFPKIASSYRRLLGRKAFMPLTFVYAT